MKPSVDKPVEMYCWIPYDQIQVVAQNISIGSINKIPSPIFRTGSKLTVGDLQLYADKARQYFNVNGSNIKVGVISDGVDEIQNSINSGDLPSINNATHILNAGEGNEGTAILEIIHDIAPGADLYFAGLDDDDGPNDMATRVTQLRLAGCKIIIDDIGFPGAPQFSDDQLYNAIYSFRYSYNGTYISSAGNDGAGCWYGTFSPNVNDTCNQWFNDGGVFQIDNSFSANNDEEIYVVLQWADKWDYARSDYDLYIFDALGAPVEAGQGINNQGTSGTIPKEEISFTYSGQYLPPFNIRVKLNSDNTPPNEPYKEMRLIVNKNETLSYTYKNFPTNPQRRQYQIYGKGMVSTLSVGAYPSSNQNILENFSSRGPSKSFTWDINGIQTGSTPYYTPGIVATDGVETSTSGFEFFEGTSASAPHIAGIAALYYSKFPAGNFYNAITSSANSIAGGTGGTFNDQSGYGKANATECLIASLYALTPGVISTNTNWTNAKISGTITINSDVTVTIPSGSTCVLAGNVTFGNQNSKIIVNSGGTLVVREGVSVDASHITGNVIFEGGIIVTQIYDDQSVISGSTFGRWENGTSFQTYSVPQNFPGITIGSNEVFKANQEIINYHKYNFWRLDGSQISSVVNHQLFPITSSNATYSAVFKNTYTATINNSIENSSVSGGTIDFKDPWFIDYPDPNYGNSLRNHGQEGVIWHTRNSPLNADYTTTYENSQAYRGVFLEQLISESNPHYRVRTSLSQSINLGGSIGTRTFYFQNWSATGANFQYPTTNETGVIFTSGNAVVSANLKGQGLSNNTNGFTKPNQRKFIYTSGGAWHLVYESMGHIWYERSYDGSTWTLMNSGKPIDKGTAAKCPAIENLGNNNVVIVYQEKNLSDNEYKIKIKNFDFQNNVVVDSSIVKEVPGNYSNEDASPAISTCYYSVNRIMVCWKEPETGDVYNPGGLYFKYGYKPTSNTTTWTATGLVSLSGTSSVLPTVESMESQSGYPVFHLAYNEVVSANSSKIYYYRLTTNSSNEVSLSSREEPSLSSQYPLNYNPSMIVLSDGTPRLSWVGEDPEMGTKITLLRARQSDNTWYATIYSFGSGVNSTSIALNSGDAGYVLGWTESNGSYNKYIRNTSFANIKNFSVTGKNLQVCNGAGWSSMYGMSFLNSSLPYYFNKSSSVSSIGKENNNNIASSRKVVLYNDSISVYYTLGDIEADGKTVDFTEIKEDSKIEDWSEFESYLTTQPFTLNNNSELDFSVLYGSSDSVKAMNWLGKDKEVKFKVELVDETTGNILGTYNNTTLNINNIFKNKTASYNVKSEGIGEKTVRLRLSIENPVEGSFALLQHYNDNNTLPKSSSEEISYKGDAIVKDYGLFQNYPNPFNPTTVINYQLPKAGNVTLKIYDALGKVVKTLVNEYKQEGKYSVEFTANNLASGMYFYELRAGDFVSTKKMLMIK